MIYLHSPLQQVLHTISYLSGFLLALALHELSNLFWFLFEVIYAPHNNLHFTQSVLMATLINYSFSTTDLLSPYQLQLTSIKDQQLAHGKHAINIEKSSCLLPEIFSIGFSFIKLILKFKLLIFLFCKKGISRMQLHRD